MSSRLLMVQKCYLVLQRPVLSKLGYPRPRAVTPSRSGEHLPVIAGNPVEWTILECAREILAVTGSKTGVLFHDLPQDDLMCRRPDITRARTLLNWDPKIGLRQGLKHSLEYFRACVTN